MGWSMQIEGARQIDKALARVEGKEAKKVVRRAVRESAKVVQRRAKANAQATVGGRMGRLLARFLIVRGQRKQRRGAFGVNLQFSPKGDEAFIHTSRTGRRTYIPAAVEYGHGATKDAAARPFMRPAWASTKEQALRRMLRMMWTGLRKVATRGKAA